MARKRKKSNGTQVRHVTQIEADMRIVKAGKTQSNITNMSKRKAGSSGPEAVKRPITEYPGQRTLADWISGTGSNMPPRVEPKTIGGQPNPVPPGPDRNDVPPRNGLLIPTTPHVGFGIRVIQGRLPRNRPDDEFINTWIRKTIETCPLVHGASTNNQYSGHHLPSIPYDAPWWLLRRILMGKICGGRLTGRDLEYANEHGFPPFCQRLPYQFGKHRCLPFRCARHYGNTCSPAAGIPRAFKTGIYSVGLLPGEGELVQQLDDKPGLTQEIAITKVRLARAIKAEQAWEEAMLIGDHEYLEEHCIRAKHTSKTGFVGSCGMMQGERTETYEAPRFKEVIHNIIHQLCKLEAHHQLVTGGSSDTNTPEEQARLAQRFLRQAKKAAMGEL